MMTLEKSSYASKYNAQRVDEELRCSAIPRGWLGNGPQSQQRRHGPLRFILRGILLSLAVFAALFTYRFTRSFVICQFSARQCLVDQVSLEDLSGPQAASEPRMV